MSDDRISGSLGEGGVGLGQNNTVNIHGYSMRQSRET